ncbi:carbohydrate ABC transporter permease [Murimonas intestini]|uniref:carbohydrate ABC transporter permease n=1 Tax=Murimonas intestini TaxID=1337051 RepID=UPI0011DCB5D9|nr:carbohydrate ABC transporter permease [Murimonas intestini]
MKKKLHAGKIIANILILSGAVISLFPFYWNASAAFKPVSEIFRYPPSFFPETFTIENFTRLTVYFPYFVRNIINSFVLAFIIPMISVLFNSMAGFAFAKYEFRGKRALFMAVLATMLLPTSSNYIPLFMEMTAFKLVDSYLAIILPGMAGAFGVFLFRQAMYAVPDELLEAARIDGAGHLLAYLRIALPMIRPMVTTVYISGFITAWNDYFWPFIILNTESKLTFPVALAGIQGQMFETPWGTIMVGALIITLPTLIIYITLSKYIVPDIFAGSVKG